MDGEVHVLAGPATTIRVCLTDLESGSLGPEQRRNALRESLPAEAFDVQEDRSQGLLRLAYRLTEGGHVHVLRCAVFRPQQRLDFSAECTQESGMAQVQEILGSLTLR